MTTGGWEFTRDAAAFLAQAGELLARDPLTSTVLATVAEAEAARAAREPGTPVPEHVRWFATWRAPGGAVAGAAMRTAPFGPRPAYVLPVPDAAARDLARSLHARAEHLTAVNGALPAALVVGEELARSSGGRAHVVERTRLHELGELVEPPAPPGRLRLADAGDAGDVATCLEWYRAFEAEAAAQAGRTPTHTGDHESEEVVAERLRGGRVWLWVLEDGTDRGHPVHLSAASEPAYGVSRIGPVLTPREHRGRGYAGATVAAVARLRREQGARVTLFTDQANAVSNRLYARLGFRPVVDMVNVEVAVPA